MLPSPVPRVFGTDAIANLLRHCKKQPEVELKVCESAKDAVDEKGETQKSLLDRLDEELKSGVGESDPPSLPKKIKGYKDTIALTSLDDDGSGIWIPITPIEKFMTLALTQSCIVPILGPLVVGILSAIARGIDIFCRTVLSFKNLWDSWDKVEQRRNEAVRDSVVEKECGVALPHNEQTYERLQGGGIVPDLRLEKEVKKVTKYKKQNHPERASEKIDLQEDNKRGPHL